MDDSEQQGIMRFCPSCGTGKHSSDKFCSVCGTPLQLLIDSPGLIKADNSQHTSEPIYHLSHEDLLTLVKHLTQQQQITLPLKEQVFTVVANPIEHLRHHRHKNERVNEFMGKYILDLLRPHAVDLPREHPRPENLSLEYVRKTNDHLINNMNRFLLYAMQGNSLQESVKMRQALADIVWGVSGSNKRTSGVDLYENHTWLASGAFGRFLRPSRRDYLEKKHLDTLYPTISDTDTALLTFIHSSGGMQDAITPEAMEYLELRRNVWDEVKREYETLPFQECYLQLQYFLLHLFRGFGRNPYLNLEKRMRWTENLHGVAVSTYDLQNLKREISDLTRTSSYDTNIHRLFDSVSEAALLDSFYLYFNPDFSDKQVQSYLRANGIPAPDKHSYLLPASLPTPMDKALEQLKDKVQNGDPQGIIPLGLDYEKVTELVTSLQKTLRGFREGALYKYDHTSESWKITAFPQMKEWYRQILRNILDKKHECRDRRTFFDELFIGWELEPSDLADFPFNVHDLFFDERFHFHLRKFYAIYPYHTRTAREKQRQDEHYKAYEPVAKLPQSQRKAKIAQIDAQYEQESQQEYLAGIEDTDPVMIERKRFAIAHAVIDVKQIRDFIKDWIEVAEILRADPILEPSSTEGNIPVSQPTYVQEEREDAQKSSPLPSLTHQGNKEKGESTSGKQQQETQAAKEKHTAAAGYSRLGEDMEGSTGTIDLGYEERKSHIEVIGRTGSGKTTLLTNIFLQDIIQGKGGAYFDPDGEALRAILRRIPDDEKKLARVFCFDPNDEKFPHINPLYCADVTSPRKVIVSASFAMHIFRRLWDIGSHTPQLENILRNCFITLICNKRTLADLPHLLRDRSFRQEMVANIPQEHRFVRWFWQENFDEWEKRVQEERTESTLNKVLSILTHPLIRNIIDYPTTQIDFKTAMEKNLVFLFRLAPEDEDEEGIAEEGVRLIGTMLVSLILKAAMSRPEGKRNFYSLVIDEFQEFASSDFTKLLFRVRKYGVAITLGYQERRQLDEDLRGAVEQTGSKVVCRTTATDAKYFAPVFAREAPPAELRREEKLEPVRDVVGHLLRVGHPNPVVNTFVQNTLMPIQQLLRDFQTQLHNRNFMDGQKKHWKISDIEELFTMLNNAFYQVMSGGKSIPVMVYPDPCYDILYFLRRIRSPYYRDSPFGVGNVSNLKKWCMFYLAIKESFLRKNTFEKVLQQKEPDIDVRQIALRFKQVRPIEDEIVGGYTCLWAGIKNHPAWQNVPGFVPLSRFESALCEFIVNNPTVFAIYDEQGKGGIPPILVGATKESIKHAHDVGLPPQWEREKEELYNFIDELAPVLQVLGQEPITAGSGIYEMVPVAQKSPQEMVAEMEKELLRLERGTAWCQIEDYKAPQGQKNRNYKMEILAPAKDVVTGTAATQRFEMICEKTYREYCKDEPIQQVPDVPQPQELPVPEQPKRKGYSVVGKPTQPQQPVPPAPTSDTQLALSPAELQRRYKDYQRDMKELGRKPLAYEAWEKLELAKYAAENE